MTTPKLAPVEVVLARSLTNQALAQRLDHLHYSRRAFDKKQADAFLEEAARRLRWGVPSHEITA